MNLNSIRCEGFWGKDETLYDLCDEYGILVMIGYNCHREWEEYLLKPTHEKYGGAGTENNNIVAEVPLVSDISGPYKSREHWRYRQFQLSVVEAFDSRRGRRADYK